jgi:hypothetical protein
MSQGHDPIVVLAGILLLLFGVVLIFAGGLCTFVMFGAPGFTGGGEILLIPLTMLALGFLSIFAGWRCMQARRDR